MSNWLTDHPNEEIRALAAEVKTMLQGNSPVEHKVNAIAEIVTPILTERVAVEDIWAGIIGEEDWTDVPVHERKFRVPNELVGAHKILTYQNGMTFPQFTFNRRQVGVETEELATPEFTIDTRELRRSDPIATVADVEAAIRRMFLIHKAKKGYDLLTAGFDTPSGSGKNITVIVDDGTYDSDNQLAYLRNLRDTVEETVQNLVASIGGNPQLALAAEALTLARLKRSGLAAEWAARVGSGSNADPGKIVYGPSLEFPLRPYAFPSATDDINSRHGEGRQIITTGDLLLIGPAVASIALTEPLDPSIIQVGHWQVAYAWRAGYAYVRWSDIGDTNRMSRIIVIREVGVQNEARGTVVVDNLSADGMNLYSTRPIDKTTVDNTSIIVSATDGGANVAGTVTPVMKGDLRHFAVTFGTPLTPGTTYFVRTVGSAGTGLRDLAGDYITPLASTTQVKCG